MSLIGHRSRPCRRPHVSIGSLGVKMVGVAEDDDIPDNDDEVEPEEPGGPSLDGSSSKLSIASGTLQPGPAYFSIC
jgi:hypothetical protein